MLYVFHVDTGTMRTFDMNLALENVVQLKEAIEKVCHIPADKQVLLVSGGDCLDPGVRVCSYSAGTDTNPIFLFSKSTIESMTPPSPSIDYGSDIDLKDQAEASVNMPHSYNTVVVRAQLAQQFYELAKEQARCCESLVHDQHLQQQGWAAVVANLEDITAAFRSRTEVFDQTFKQHLESREEYIQLLHNYKEDLEMLAKIPLISALITEKESLTSSTTKESETKEKPVEEVTESASTLVRSGAGNEVKEQEEKMMTLFEWISAKDNQSSLELLAEQCSHHLEQFDSHVVEALKTEMYAALEAANKTEMKEIKGLEERLFGLEQLMFEAKRIVQEQTDLAQAFLQNQNRASNLGDPSILPDLCTSHKRQMLVMLKNHHQLRDIKRRCTRAKEELSTNLYHRLRWVMYVENHIYEVDSKFMIYHESLKRLRRQLEIVRQIHLAPQMYVKAVGEVVRRRTFSQAFLVWASDLACQLLTVYNDEVARRQEFQRQFEGHFLNTLFPGMEDMPPSFATQAPSVFDSGLPKLTVDDVDRLKNELPELNISLSLPDLGAITQFFLSKSVSGTMKTEEKEDTALEDRLVKVVTDAGLASNLDPTLLQTGDADTVVRVHSSSPISLQEPAAVKEPDRGFESETDTEEFEKVGQSPVDLGFDTRQTRPVTGAAVHCEPSAEQGHEGESGSAAALERVATLEVGVRCESAGSAHTLPTPSPSPAPSPCSPSSAQHQSQLQQQEFTTTDFYIDESMPSSYTESNSARCHSQGASDLRRQLEDVNTLVALLQENLGNTREEVERLQLHLRKAGTFVGSYASELRNELAALRGLVLAELAQLSHTANELAVAAAADRDGAVQRLTVDHELEMEALRRDAAAAADARDEELRRVRDELSTKEEKAVAAHSDLVAQLSAIQAKLETEISHRQELQSKLDAFELEKQRALKELSDRLTHDYKTELEGLRSRFRLMTTTSMERSPSDSSLERIERADLVELAYHEQQMNQLREKLLVEKESAVKTAVETERKQWDLKLQEELKKARRDEEAKKQITFNEVVRQVVQEKDQMVDEFRTREASLVAECQRLQETVRRLTEDTDARSLESKTDSATKPLLDKLEQLETEKVLLQRELAKERARKSRTLSETALSDLINESKPPAPDMSTSVAVMQDVKRNRDAATSPDRVDKGVPEQFLQENLTRSASSLIQQGKISIVSCNVGDAVLVVWNEVHRNYLILQETSTLYFLHQDCLDILGLRPSSDGSQRRLYCTGEVTDKEYCHALKPQNRFNVPKGTKFFRVKVRPLPKIAAPRCTHHHQHHHHHHHQCSGGSSSSSTAKDSSLT
ncbi:RB1-inducible coiled-coil protein 1 isoform X1 [Schistocerca piceifrons]|uniref:RB1-inducible coiled-coil protein 1 isoform X1 n=1 Tax=Schistocerca piceifrons TaxID=274613 RepID=UPI001F5F0E91|nr:RB1-inducible coiled-coil protein 1 isoform X1 [Schistocerca piceifrons]XP_047116872.1 RB1-inducible coiled-coil protein 1 isoform X1 [Schistocerca piceifrons]